MVNKKIKMKNKVGIKTKLIMNKFRIMMSNKKRRRLKLIFNRMNKNKPLMKRKNKKKNRKKNRKICKRIKKMKN